ncbi:MAG: hypothetical protein DMD60_12445 [Gemmatimonadetes bacterium]|nr:MAG: hypothetical protein DMD60_12445 [Gemmatimonadota bacterium]
MMRSLICLLAGVGLAPAPRPRLVVVITVDQLRPDYLERYHSQLLGGFATLLKGGASFSDAYQDHAITETAPGHSTILSGRWPFPGAVSRDRVLRLAQGLGPGRARSLGVGEGPRRDPADWAGQGAGLLVYRGLLHHESVLRGFSADVGAHLQRTTRTLPRGGNPMDALPPGAGLPRGRQRLVREPGAGDRVSPPPTHRQRASGAGVPRDAHDGLAHARLRPRGSARPAVGRSRRDRPARREPVHDRLRRARVWSRFA